MKVTEEKLYHPADDPAFSSPYIDCEEWRDLPERHYYVHGGFAGTGDDGANEARFCFYFPEKKKYEGRFFHYVSPAPENEHNSESLTGEDDKIRFCLTHGAYYVVSNQSGGQPGDVSWIYKVNAATAEFSRTVAERVYGTDARPYGYIFGGSGGSFKTMGCMEATEGIWDGAVPYVMANPMAAPNVFAPRMRVVRLLGEEGLRKIVEAMDPGGSGDIYEGLDALQEQALKEATAMGFPERAWFSYPYMGDGALMVLVPTLYQLFPTYFKDFWEAEGYEGADPASAEARDRMRHVTKVAEVRYNITAQGISGKELSSVDTSWINTLTGGAGLPDIYMEEELPAGAYTYHCRLRVLDGGACGEEINIDRIEGKRLILHPDIFGSAGRERFQALKPGDTVMVDNSDAIAMQCFHRHQIPDRTYRVYDQFRDENGEPRYPQLPMLIAPIISINGAGLLLTGNMHGKIIGLCSMLDESACPWHGDWYREAIRRNGVDEKNQFRLYYHDNSIHDDRAGKLDDPQRQVDYIGTLNQALLDVAAWCEKGIEPLPTTNYTFRDGQIRLPDGAAGRGGLQPVVKAVCTDGNGVSEKGGKVARVKAGEPVVFTAVIEVPPRAGTVTRAAWDYELSNDWSHGEELLRQEDGSVLVKTTHIFERPGTYFPCIKVQSNRHGDLTDIFTQSKNLDRVRVIVE